MKQEETSWQEVQAILHWEVSDDLFLKRYSKCKTTLKTLCNQLGLFSILACHFFEVVRTLFSETFAHFFYRFFLLLIRIFLSLK